MAQGKFLKRLARERAVSLKRQVPEEKSKIADRRSGSCGLANEVTNKENDPGRMPWNSHMKTTWFIWN
jgi:hypothetical protein